MKSSAKRLKDLMSFTRKIMTHEGFEVEFDAEFYKYSRGWRERIAKMKIPKDAVVTSGAYRLGYNQAIKDVMEKFGRLK